MARRAYSLTTLVNQVNAAYPNRNKASDGWIGDSAHSSRVSQHNPNGAGVVTAQDVTHDPAHGVDGQALAGALVLDPRCWYVIFNRRIRYHGGAWQAYSGSNPHTTHVHISTKQDAANYDNGRAWPITPASSGGGDDMINNTEEANLFYKAVLLRDGESEAVLKANVGKPWHTTMRAFLNSAERKAVENAYRTMSQTVKDLQVALENEKNKPPKEVIKEVQKIIEKPVEVIKEVPAPVDEQKVVQGWLARLWNNLFKRDK